MPKNKGKGGKNRRRGKNENEGAKRELILKDEGQVTLISLFIFKRNRSQIKEYIFLFLSSIYVTLKISTELEL